MVSAIPLSIVLCFVYVGLSLVNNYYKYFKLLVCTGTWYSYYSYSHGSVHFEIIILATCSLAIMYKGAVCCVRFAAVLLTCIECILLCKYFVCTILS